MAWLPCRRIHEVDRPVIPAAGRKRDPVPTGKNLIFERSSQRIEYGRWLQEMVGHEPCKVLGIPPVPQEVHLDRKVDALHPAASDRVPDGTHIIPSDQRSEVRRGRPSLSESAHDGLPPAHHQPPCCGHEDEAADRQKGPRRGASCPRGRPRRRRRRLRPGCPALLEKLPTDELVEDSASVELAEAATLDNLLDRPLAVHQLVNLPILVAQ